MTLYLFLFTKHPITLKEALKFSSTTNFVSFLSFDANFQTFGILDARKGGEKYAKQSMTIQGSKNRRIALLEKKRNNYI